MDDEGPGTTTAKDAMHALFIYLLDALLISAVGLATDSERCPSSSPARNTRWPHGWIGAFDAAGRANLGVRSKPWWRTNSGAAGRQVGHVKTGEGHEVDILERELCALEDAAREHRRAKRRLLVLTRDQVPAVTAPGLLAQPAYEWLLAGPVHV